MDKLQILSRQFTPSNSPVHFHPAIFTHAFSLKHFHPPVFTNLFPPKKWVKRNRYNVSAGKMNFYRPKFSKDQDEPLWISDLVDVWGPWRFLTFDFDFVRSQALSNGAIPKLNFLVSGRISVVMSTCSVFGLSYGRSGNQFCAEEGQNPIFDPLPRNEKLCGNL